MNVNQKRLFPNWCNDTNTNYTLCLSDDLDSLLSCIFLKQIKGYKISHFYTFQALGISVKHDYATKDVIAVDADMTKGKCWGNHVTILSEKDNYNKNCANINITNNISRNNYTDKFCGSTLLQILSYYDVDISTWTEEQKMILMCIDSSFLPFYSPRFKPTGTKWIKDILEYPELVELTEKYSKSDFEQLNKKYNLKSKINIDNGYLSTDIDLAGLSKVFNMQIELPTQQFELLAEFKTYRKQLNNSTVKKPSKVFSLAITRRNEAKYSKVV